MSYQFSSIVGGGAYDAPRQPSDPRSGPSPKGLALLRKAPAPTRFIVTEQIRLEEYIPEREYVFD